MEGTAEVAEENGAERHGLPQAARRDGAEAPGNGGRPAMGEPRSVPRINVNHECDGALPSIPIGKPGFERGLFHLERHFELLEHLEDVAQE